jgi:hypothetical protein
MRHTIRPEETMKRNVLLLFAFLVAIVPHLYAAKGKAVTSPGTYKSWGEAEIDEIEIVKPFSASSYDRIAVVPFDTSKVEPTGKEAVVIQGALDGYTAVFVEGLRDDIAAKGTKIEITDKAPKSVKTLIVRGAVEELNPGSRAKRALAGYGTRSASSWWTRRAVPCSFASLRPIARPERSSSPAAAPRRSCATAPARWARTPPRSSTRSDVRMRSSRYRMA